MDGADLHLLSDIGLQFPSLELLKSRQRRLSIELTKEFNESQEPLPFHLYEAAFSLGGDPFRT